MTPPPHLLQPYRLALGVIARAVPPAHRSSWLAEWHAELWHVAAAAALEQPSATVRHRSVAAFCCGAFADAHCLRRLEHPGSSTAPTALAAGSAPRCLATLALFAIVACGLVRLLPGVHAVTSAALAPRSTRTVAIWTAGGDDSLRPLLRLNTVRSWQHRSQHLFTRFAFFAIVPKAVHIDARHAPELAVARGSQSLVDLLEGPVAHRQPLRPGEAEVFLSRSVWRSHFGARPEIVGDTLRVGLQTARIAGVLPDSAAPPGQHIDLWLLLPDALADKLPGIDRVFTFAELAPPAELGVHFDERWHMSVPGAPDGSTDFDCVSLAAIDPHPFHLFFFSLALALLALPALTPLTLGDVPPSTPSPTPLPRGLRARSRRWLFLAAKLALILPAICAASLDLAYALPPGFAAPQTLQLVTAFPMLLFALQWALHDQRHRCPTCLRTLSCPARVGQPSRNFLSWNGTELICTGGHGLLHVPELPTSWFSQPRWLHLDPSWQSLFLPA